MTTDLDDPAALRSTIQRAVRDARPDGDPGPAAIAAGRRIRQRRRVGLAAASVAAVAAVGALAVPLVGGSTDAGGRDDHGFATDGPSGDPAPSPVGETP